MISYLHWTPMSSSECPTQSELSATFAEVFFFFFGIFLCLDTSIVLFVKLVFCLYIVIYGAGFYGFYFMCAFLVAFGI